MTTTSSQRRALIHLDAFLDRVHPGFADDKRLHDEARALSHAYTTGVATGVARATFSNDAASTIAYLAHFGPRAIAAVSHALAFTTLYEGIAGVVDIGAGSGASALAAVMAGAKSVTLVDSSARSLSMAQRLLEGTGARVTVHARDADGFVDKNAQLLLSAFAFGELPGEPADAFASLAACAPNAKAIVVVDAGDRPRARRLQTARDAIAAGALPLTLRIRGPCAHLEPCPALVRERDWCHARIDKGLVGGDATGAGAGGDAAGAGGDATGAGVERLARFARAVGRDDQRMSASFLVLDDRPAIGSGRSDGSDGSDGGDGGDGAEVALVVIGDPRKEKGRARLPVCGPGGLRYLQALKRDRAAFDALLHVARGARLPVAAARDVREGTGHIVDPATLK